MAPINRSSTCRVILNAKRPTISAENVIAGKHITFSKRKAENSPPKNGNFKRPALNDLTNDGKTAKVKSLLRNGKSCKPVSDIPEEKLTSKSNLSTLETRSRSSKLNSGIKIQGPFKGKSNLNPRSTDNASSLKNTECLRSKPSIKAMPRTSVATRSSVSLKSNVGKVIKTDKNHSDKSIAQTCKILQDLSVVNGERHNSIKPAIAIPKLKTRSSTLQLKSHKEETISHEPAVRRSLRISSEKSDTTSCSQVTIVETKTDVRKTSPVEVIAEEPVNCGVKLRRSLRSSVRSTEISACFSEEIDVSAKEPKVTRRSSARLSLRKSLPCDKTTESGSLYVSALEEINSSVKEEENEPKDEQLYHHLSEFDKELLHDPQQVSLYAMEIFDYLKSREDHFSISDYMSRQPVIDKKMRAMLVDWMVEVQENFELNHETLYLSVKLMDSYLSHVDIRKESLQLVGAASLFLSCKYDERLSPLIEEFEYVGDGAYDRNHLLTMEQNILKHVNYELSFPLSYSFLRRYARCARIQMPLLTLARYILELGLMEYDTVTLSDSKQAAAVLYLAFRMVKHSCWTDSLRYYTGYDVEDFKDIVILFNRILHKQPSSQLTTIKNKYSHELFFKVAETPLINDEDLNLND